MRLKKGLQISADFIDCKANLQNPQKIAKTVKNICKENNITVLKASSFVFSNNGATILFLLSESHLAIHTWPEKKLVNFDLFVCNYKENNVSKVKNTYKKIKEFFGAQKVEYKEIVRLT